MKKIQFFITTLLLAFSLFILQSCEKTENQVTLISSSNPVLTANRTTSIPLSLANKDAEAVKFSWTNPDYRFNTGISSQSVNYDVEIDTTGKNFNSGKKQVIALSTDLSIALTQGTLNDYLLNQLVFAPGVPVTIDVRVRAYIRESPSTTLYSSTLKFSTTPYVIPPKVELPTGNELFLVGDASQGGWNNPVPVPTQKFTRVSATLYEITVPFTNGVDKAFLMLPVNGSWADKYGFDGANKMNNVNGFDLKRGGGDVLAPAVGGNYKISVDFQRGKVSVTKL
jgi:starch-binding outer membrane protein SusE/F